MRSPTALTFASVDIMISNLTPAPSFRPSTTSQIQRFQVFTCRINAREKEYRFQLTASVHSRPDHVNSVTRFSVEESYRRGWDHNRQLCILRIGGSSTMTMGCRPRYCSWDLPTLSQDIYALHQAAQLEQLEARHESERCSPE